MSLFQPHIRLAVTALEAGLGERVDDAVGAGGGQVVSGAGQRGRGPQHRPKGSVRTWTSVRRASPRPGWPKADQQLDSLAMYRYTVATWCARADHGCALTMLGELGLTKTLRETKAIRQDDSPEKTRGEPCFPFPVD